MMIELGLAIMKLGFILTIFVTLPLVLILKMSMDRE